MHKLRLAVCLALVVALLAALVPLSGSPSARAQEGGDPPLPVAGFGEHPRILITRSYVKDTLIPRYEQDTSTWQALRAYVDSGGAVEDAEWTAGTALRSLAVAWLVTGESAYADQVRAIMVDLVNAVETDPLMRGEGEIDSILLENVEALALGYDWLYAALSDDDRAALADVLWRSAKQLRNPANDTDGIIWLDGDLMAFGNYEPRWLWTLTAVGLALYGEHPDAGTLIDYCREVFTGTVIPALDLQEGGAWSEGPVYGFIANWPKVQTALAWWTALGENYFAATDWWYDRLAYDMFLYHPAPTTSYNADWGDPMHGYPSIIGDSERYHAIAVWGRAQDLLLRTVYARTTHGDWMDWFLRQPPGMPAWMAVEEFLWRDLSWAGFPPTDFTWTAPYNGHVFMRSNWVNDQGGLDTTATYVSFNAGDHLSYHQFFDQGNFTLFHNGADLVVRSGVYSGDGTSDHDANYYVRSIAANTILVCDLAETFDGIRPNNDRDVWLNDCGQRSLYPAPRTAINVDFLIENWQSYDTGSITRLGTVGDATYIRADITGAYNSTVYTTPDNRAKVESVVRDLVYWRPGVVIVSDRVTTTYPSYTPLVTFHFQTEPQPAGLAFRVLVDDAALYMQNLLPNSRITVTRGYEVAGQTVDQSWGEPVENNFESEPYGLYRLDITPGQPDLEHWFLTAFQAQDADADPPPEGVLVLGEGVRGVKWGTVQVLFDAEPGDEADITGTAFPIGEGVQLTLVTGLQPGGTYQLEADGRLVGTLAADDAGLLALSGIPAGGVELTLSDGDDANAGTSEPDSGASEAPGDGSAG